MTAHISKIFVEQIEISCETMAAIPRSSLQCGPLDGLVDVIKILWRTLWNPQESIGQTARAMLSDRAISPAAVRWFTAHTITKIFQGARSDDTVLQDAAKWAVVHARTEHTKLAIASVFKDTFQQAAQDISHIATAAEDQRISQLLQDGREILASHDHQYLPQTFQELHALAAMRSFTAAQTQQLQALEARDPALALNELRAAPLQEPELHGLIAGYAGVLTEQEKQKIVQEIVQKANGALNLGHYAKIGEIGQTITSLSLNGLQFPLFAPILMQYDSFLRLLQELPALTKLTLTDCRLTDAQGAAIAPQLSRLEELDISGTPVKLTTYLSVYSSPFQRLCVLKMDNSGLGDDALTSLTTMPALQRLSLRGGENERDTRFTAPLKIISQKCPNLTHLDLGNSKTMTPAQLAGLEELLHLQQLTLTDCPLITQADIKALRARFPKLEIVA